MFGSPVQMVIVLLVVALLFGTGKLKNIGKDLGTAIKDFKSTMTDDDDKKAPPPAAAAAEKKPGE